MHFTTPKIPKEGYIKIYFNNDVTIPNNERGYFCEPGDNIPKSDSQAFECVRIGI